MADKVKVTDAIVRTIVKLHADGDAVPVIAAAVTMSRSAVRVVLHAKGKTDAAAPIRERARANLRRWLAPDSPNGSRKKTAAKKAGRKRAAAGAGARS